MLAKIKKKLKIPLINTLNKIGVKPNHLTYLALIIALIALTQPLYVALTLFFTSFILDVMDGNLARRHGKTTKFGGVLDSVFDKIVELLFIYYLGNQFNVQGLAVISGGLSIMISYTKQRSGMDGLTTFFDRAERMIFLTLSSLLIPNSFQTVLAVFIILCSIVIAQLLLKVKKS
jgi:phosphatidylglycerophosphate synthase